MDTIYIFGSLFLYMSYYIAQGAIFNIPYSINQSGKEYKKKNVSICITESLCCTAVINTTL